MSDSETARPGPSSSGPNSGRIEIEFDLRVYALETIERAAHRMMDRCFIELAVPNSSAVCCVLRPRVPLTNLENLRGEFQNQVLDQHLRHQLDLSTRGVRDLIIAQAFSRTNLLHPELDQDSNP